jgi:hypothetical protein
MIFYKLTDNLNIPVDQILSTITNVTTAITSPIIEGKSLPLDPSAGEVWQYYPYPSNILFLRNWKDLHSRLTVIIELKKLQDTMRASNNRNKLIDVFLNIKFDTYLLGAIKVVGEVDPHADITRKYAITIGLKNSSAYRTYVSSASTSADFTPDDTLSYIVGDREVYITEVDSVHSVVPISNPVDRFTLSYSTI